MIRPRLTEEQKNEALAALRKAVQGRLDSWDAQRELEGVLSFDIDGADSAIADLCSTCTTADDLPASALADFFGMVVRES